MWALNRKNAEKKILRVINNVIRKDKRINDCTFYYFMVYNSITNCISYVFSGFNRLYVLSPNGNGLVRSNDDSISVITIYFRWNRINCICT